MHYRQLIQMFGAPNGLCSSITESKHIEAVKEPWWRSSWHNAIGQMLLTNQRMDKLAMARVDFVAQGLMLGRVVAEKKKENQDIEVDADDRPKCLGEVQLAKTRGISYMYRNYQTKKLIHSTWLPMRSLTTWCSYWASRASRAYSAIPL
jgi:hypothetical protein